jgi:hypothetical protein
MALVAVGGERHEPCSCACGGGRSCRRARGTRRDRQGARRCVDGRGWSSAACGPGDPRSAGSRRCENSHLPARGTPPRRGHRASALPLTTPPTRLQRRRRAAGRARARRRWTHPRLRSALALPLGRARPRPDCLAGAGSVLVTRRSHDRVTGGVTLLRVSSQFSAGSSFRLQHSAADGVAISTVGATTNASGVGSMDCPLDARGSRRHMPSRRLERSTHRRPLRLTDPVGLAYGVLSSS